MKGRIGAALSTILWLPHLAAAQAPPDTLPEALRTQLEACEEGWQSASTLLGFVTDSATAISLEDAVVRATWAEGEREMHTGPGGAFALCSLPTGTEIQVAVEAMLQRWRNAVVTIPSAGLHRIDPWVPLFDPSRTGTIVGRVVEAGTGRPLTGVAVSTPEGGEAVTTRNGYFVFRELPAGRHPVSVERLGYGARTDTVEVLGGYPVEVTVLLSEEAIPLEGLTVTVKPSSWFLDMDGFYHRMSLGFGHFITRADLQRRNPPTFIDALRGIPSVRFSRRRGPRQVYGIRLRYTSTMGDCRPMFYLDGVPYRHSQDDHFDPNEFHPLDIEAIEVYRGPAEVPGEFSGSEARCGVIAIWTRR